MKPARPLAIACVLGALGLASLAWYSLRNPQAEPDRPPVESVQARHTPAPTAAPAASVSQASLRRALGWLSKAQSSDGGWHSETYGQLRGGAAITALVLYAVSHAPAEMLEVRDRQMVERGFQFLRPAIAKHGCVLNPDGSADYPTYASALTFVAARQLPAALDAGLQEKLLAYLIDSQLGETQGWLPEDVQYGGWDFMGRTAAERTTTGTNLSVTAFVLEAVAAVDSPSAKPVLARAQRWLERCQDFPGQGGFVFSPVADDASNKAGYDAAGQRARGYGSMTCDGLRALFYCQVDSQDRRFRAAAGWIAEHPNLEGVPGFEQSPQSGWQSGLRYYYYASLAKSLPLLQQKSRAAIGKSLADQLIANQATDGSWQNPSARMREDDPQIATALAVVALAASSR